MTRLLFRFTVVLCWFTVVAELDAAGSPWVLVPIFVSGWMVGAGLRDVEDSLFPERASE